MDGPTLKITLVEEANAASAARPNSLLDQAMGITPAPPSQTTTGSDFDPVKEAHRLLEAEARRQQVDEARLQILKEQGRFHEEVFDPVVQAQKLLEAEARRQQISEARLAILREQGKIKDEVFDPVAEAQRLFELEERRHRVQEEVQKLRGPVPGFDPVAEAEKLIESSRRRAQIEAARLNLLGGPADVIDMTPEAEAVFDPVHEAKKRQEAERKKTQVQAAYENLQGPADVLDPSKDKKREQWKELGNFFGGAGLGQAGGLVHAAGQFATAATPMGAAIAGLELADRAGQMLAESMDGARQQIQLLGQATVQIAGNDYLGAFQTGVEEVAGALEKIPIAGQVFGSALRLAAAPVVAFTEVVGAFVKRGTELAQWSPELTAAGVHADIRSMMADIREADRLGPGLAKLTDAQNQAWIELRELLLPLKEVVVNVLVVHLQAIVEVLRAMRSANEVISETIKTILTVLVQLATGQWIKAGLEIAKHAGTIAEIVKRHAQKLDEDLADYSPEAVLGDLLAEVKDWGRLHKQPTAPDANAGMPHAPIFDGILRGP